MQTERIGMAHVEAALMETDPDEEQDLGLDDTLSDPTWQERPKEVRPKLVYPDRGPRGDSGQPGKRRQSASPRGHSGRWSDDSSDSDLSSGNDGARDVPRAEEADPVLEQPWLEDDNSRLLYAQLARFFEGRRVLPAADWGPGDGGVGGIHVGIPLTPFSGPDEGDFEAFKLCKREALWKSRSVANWKGAKMLNSETVLREAVTKAYHGETMSHSTSRYQNLLRNCHSFLNEHPLGPDHLRPYDCLRLVGGPGGEPHLAYAKGHAVYAKGLVEETSASDDRHPWPFEHRLKEDMGLEIANYYSQPMEPVLGFDYASDGMLFFLRHSRSVSLVDFNGDIRHDWKRDSDLCSAAALPLQDAVALLDVEGSLVLNSYESNETINVWEGGLQDLVGRFGWGRVLAGGSVQTAFRAAGRRKAVLFDTRTALAADRVLHVVSDCGSAGQWRHGEVIGALANSARQGNDHCVYIATSDRLVLADERMCGKKPVHSWIHGLTSVPVGCQTLVVDGGEYLATYTAEGEVEILTATWKEGNQAVQSNMRKLPGVLEGLASPRNVPPVGLEFMDMSWTGMSLLPRTCGFSLVTLNAAGTLLCCELDLGQVEEDGRRSRAHREQGVASRWENWSENIGKGFIYKKRPLATTLYERPSLPETHLVRSIPPVRPLNWKFAASIQAEKRAKKKWNREHHVVQEEKPPNHFKSLPWLKPLNLDEHNDIQGERVAKIFSGESLYPHLSGSASDTSTFEPVSRRRRRQAGKQPRRKRRPSAGVQVPKDSGYTMESFLRNLDPEMTSTQENPTVVDVPDDGYRDFLGERDSQPASASLAAPFASQRDESAMTLVATPRHVASQPLAAFSAAKRAKKDVKAGKKRKSIAGF